MKTRWIYLALFALFISSCGDHSQTSHVTQKQPVEEGVYCLDTNYHVYRETMAMWVNSWQTAQGLAGTDSFVTRFASRSNLDRLRELYPEAIGVRMYYCLTDPDNPNDTVPALALVNMSECEDLIDEERAVVLVSDHSGQRFMTVAEACPYTQAWRSFIESKRPVGAPVFAYNYLWESIDELFDDPRETSDLLCVRFGLRTISPADTVFEITDDNHYGNIVPANVIFIGEDPEAGRPFLDFTAPCPKYCGVESALILDCY